MAKFAAGIDIGGSSAKIGLFNGKLERVRRCEPVDTTKMSSGDDLVAHMARSIADGLSQEGSSLDNLVGVGIGSPGPLDTYRGIVMETPNIPILSGYPLRERMANACGQEVWLDNDANVFVLGEAQVGAAKDYPIVLGVTLGTGFGWGIVFDGKVYHGATGTAAEYGPTPWQDGGQTWEDDISIRGVMKNYHAFGGKAESPKEVSDLAAGGDAAARKTWERYGWVLGLALTHAVNLIDPHIIVVGGSIAGAWDHFLPTMEKTLRSNIYALPRERLKIVRSILGEQAALFGAVSQVPHPWD